MHIRLMTPQRFFAVSETQQTILIVQGAGCAQLAQLILPEYLCFDWQQFFAGPEREDIVKDRDVQLWALDSREALKAAPALLKVCASIAVVDTSKDEAGIDFSRVLAQRATGDAVADFIRARLKPITQPKKHDKSSNGKGRHVRTSPGLATAFSVWQSLGLECNAQGMPFPTIANAAIVLSAHPEIKDRIWFNDFTRKIMQTVAGQVSAWTDAEDLNVCVFLQQALKMPRMALGTVQHAIQQVAFCRRRNPLQDYLKSLVWDGVERLGSWLADFLGADNDEYTQTLGRNWIISMIARASLPGCKADHMPVLEGKMGKGKSSVLEILGGEWYKAAPQAFGSKEFFEVIQGAWLIEIPDMVGFGRREHSQIISAITTRSDSYRASYARHAEEHPRTCIFAATSENDDYLKDARGIRRYWPIRCTDISLEPLRGARDQIFAEAVHLFGSGSGWYEMPSEVTAKEQQARQEADIWVEPIAYYCAARAEVTVREIAMMCLHIDTEKHDQTIANRVARCLIFLGFSKSKPEWIEGKTTRVYRRAAKL